MLKIDSVAVLGTGVMGAQIAAHCTRKFRNNCGRRFRILKNSESIS